MAVTELEPGEHLVIDVVFGVFARTVEDQIYLDWQKHSEFTRSLPTVQSSKVWGFFNIR